MKLFIIVICIFSCGSLQSQKLEPIVTDRPDQTESASIIPKGFVQIETGITLEEDEPISGLNIRAFSLPAVLIRYGVFENVELRLGSEYISEKRISINGTLVKNDGTTPISVGTKIKMFSEKGPRPQTSFIFHLVIPYSKESVFHTAHIGTDFRFTMQHVLSKRITLSYNFGGAWSGDTPAATGIYTLSLGISLIKKLSAYVESYGFLTQEETPDHRLDGGFTYLFDNNIQADVSGGVGITAKSPDYIIGAGFSIRLPR